MCNSQLALARDQVVLPETAANLWASRRKTNDFLAVFSSFELGGVTKYVMTGPAGNNEFCFPSSDLKEGLGETKVTVSLGASH